MTNTQITEEMKAQILAMLERWEEDADSTPIEALANIENIINPPQKVEPLAIKVFIYRADNGEIFITTNDHGNVVGKLDTFTIEWSGKNTARIVPDGQKAGE